MKLKSMKCPCEDCLCVPICSYKHYYTLFHECFLISTYIKQPYVGEICIDELKIAKKILQPTQWTICGDIMILKTRN